MSQQQPPPPVYNNSTQQSGYGQQGNPSYNPNNQQGGQQEYYNNDNYPKQEHYDQNNDPEAQKNSNHYNQPTSEENYDQAFKIDKPRFNDWPFAIFFLLVFGGFIALAGLCINAYRKTHSFQGGSIYNNPNSFTLNTNTVILFSFIVVIALVFSYAIIIFARLSPKLFIISGLVLNVIFGIGTAIYFFVKHYYGPAIVFLIFLVLSAIGYWSARSRIPLSATILTITIDVMKKHPSTLAVSFISVLISGGFSIFLSIALVSAYVKFDPNSNNQGCNVDGGSCSQSKLIGVLVFMIFAGYYISEVFKNIVHVTIAGVYGSWYYLESSDQGGPKHPALGALKRALTFCFGSICFGSLIVAIIQFIQGLLRYLKQAAFDNGDFCGGCALLIAEFILNFISWLVQYFNHYAYCYIALYGKNYVRSAKDTFDLIRFKGMDALINDCFINTSLNLWSLMVGYITALFAYFFLQFTKPAYNDTHAYTAPVVAFGFLIAGQFTRVTLVVIESGVSTFFVALAKDPEIFQMTNRERFNEIFHNYPQVLQKITANN